MVPVLFETSMQAERQSLSDTGKRTFPLSVRFPIGLRNPHLNGEEGAVLKVRLAGLMERT